jgi:SHS family lactate transporter-like MFS transporter
VGILQVVVELDLQQRRTLTWAGLAVVLFSFGGSILILALPAVATEFHANVPALANLGSVLALGALGALPLATLADHFGRRRLIAIGVAGFSIANLASAFAPSLVALAMLRIVAVCFEALVASVTTALIVEEAPPSHRGSAVSLLAVLSGSGVLIAVVAYPILAPHWRWLFALSGLGVMAAPLIWRHLPEGRAWQRVRVGGSTVKLLLSAPWRRRVAILAGATMLVSLVLEPAGLLYTFFASSVLRMSPSTISLLIFAAGAVALASYLAGGYLSDRFGRRLPAFALTAAYTISAGLEFVTGMVGFIAGNLLWSAFASAATPVLGAWSGELYPTRARATAESAASVAGAIGGIAGLQAVAALSQSIGLGRALGLASVVGLAGAGLLLLLPETKQAPLPD